MLPPLIIRRSKWAYTKTTMSEFAIPRNFETYLHVPNAAARFDEALSVAAKIGSGRRIVAKSRSCSIKISLLIASIHFRSDPTTPTCRGELANSKKPRGFYPAGEGGMVEEIFRNRQKLHHLEKIFQ